MKTKKQIMTEAHKIAKTLEGNYAACLSEALKISWKNAKENFTPDFLIDYNFSEMNVKDIYEHICLGFNSSIKDRILLTVAEKSTGFQKDIATKALAGSVLTYKQAWCIAFELKNVA